MSASVEGTTSAVAGAAEALGLWMGGPGEDGNTNGPWALVEANIVGIFQVSPKKKYVCIWPTERNGRAGSERYVKKLHIKRLH